MLTKPIDAFYALQILVILFSFYWTIYGIWREKIRWVVEGVALFVVTVIATMMVASR